MTIATDGAEALALEIAEKGADDPSSHTVQFYENDSFLIESVSRFIGAALGAGAPALLIATAAHRQAIEDLLRGRGLDLAKAQARGRYLALDARETLDQFMVNGAIEPVRFAQAIAGTLAKFSPAGESTSAFSEMVALLCEEDRLDAALKLEELWNAQARVHSLALLCAYPLASFAGEGRREVFERICARHSHVLPSEAYAQLPEGEPRGKAVAALQQQAKSLEMEISARQEAEKARILLAAIVDSSDDAIISKSLDGIISSWNAGAVRIFGYTADEVIGKHITILIPRERLDEETEIISKLRRGQRIEHFETVRMAKDGRLVHISLTVSPVRDGQGRLVGASKIARDITERVRMAEKARTQNDRVGLLSEAAGHLLASDQPEEMVRGLFERVRNHIGVDAFINYVAGGEDMLSLLSWGGIPDALAQSIGRLPFGEGICGLVAATRRPMIVSDLQHSSEPRAQIMRELGIRAVACNPLLAGHRLLGTLSFASRTRDRFEEDELEFIRTLCHYVAIAYERVRLLNELRLADKRKDEFLATLAHELRNPLAPISSGLEILRLGAGNAESNARVREVMDRQVKHLVRLVDDLLEMSRITSGKISLRKEPVELAALLRGAIDSSFPMIEKSRHALTVSLPPERITLQGDPVRLAQVFVNLLNNAAKYTEERGEIDIKAVRQGGEVMVAIRDSGLGIPEALLPRVFDMFAQVDRTLSRSQGGLGIGLALARRLVEMHGGRIEARSGGLGRGSEFRVHLPVVAAEAPQPEVPPANNIPAPARRRRVLVVDDNRDAATALDMFRKLLKHETCVAYNGIQAVDAAEEFRPDLVLMDIGMPEMDGFEAARRIREKPWAQATQLVALTGWGQDEDRRRSRESGFDQHFTKPLNTDALLSLLSEHESAAIS